jgi:hypothetical protein
MNCQRCSSTRGGPVVARIRGEIVNLAVCAPCASEAADLGLNVEPLDPASGRAKTMVAAAA